MVRRVRANLLAHDLDAKLEFPEFAIASPPLQEGARFPASLYYDLSQAAQASDQTWIQLAPVQSRWPLVARLKRAFHQVIVYYVNMLGERQMMVNSALTRVLTQMVATLDQQDEIESLQRQVAELRARLEQLEKNEDKDG